MRHKKHVLVVALATTLGFASSATSAPHANANAITPGGVADLGFFAGSRHGGWTHVRNVPPASPGEAAGEVWQVLYPPRSIHNETHIGVRFAVPFSVGSITSVKALPTDQQRVHHLILFFCGSTGPTAPFADGEVLDGDNGTLKCEQRTKVPSYDNSSYSPPQPPLNKIHRPPLSHERSDHPEHTATTDAVVRQHDGGPGRQP